MLGRIIARAFEEVQAAPGAAQLSRVVMRAHQIIDELPEHERRWISEQALRRAVHDRAREHVRRRRATSAAQRAALAPRDG